MGGIALTALQKSTALLDIFQRVIFENNSAAILKSNYSFWKMLCQKRLVKISRKKMLKGWWKKNSKQNELHFVLTVKLLAWKAILSRQGLRP